MAKKAVYKEFDIPNSGSGRVDLNNADLTDATFAQVDGYIELGTYIEFNQETEGVKIWQPTKGLDGYDLTIRAQDAGYGYNSGDLHLQSGFSQSGSGGEQGAITIDPGGTEKARFDATGLWFAASGTAKIGKTEVATAGVTLTIKGQESTGGSTDGGNLYVESGDANGGNSGLLSLSSGDSSGAGGSGDVRLFSGTPGTTGGSGDVYVYSESAGGTGNGSSGNVTIYTSLGRGTGAGGDISLLAGNGGASGSGGDIILDSGASNSGPDGYVTFKRDGTIFGQFDSVAAGNRFYVSCDTEIDGKLTVSGLIDPTGLVLDEQASVPGGNPGAGKGTFWVKNDSPSAPYFTDDAGTDHDLLASGTAEGQALYDAIVDAGGGGDYTSVAAAFNDGYYQVFVRSGQYVETSNIVLPNGARLIGEGSVYIVLSGSVSITADGSGGTYENTGTISITSGTSAVSGSGTTFTNLSSGEFISIGGTFYEIDTVTDNTNLTIVETYEGATVSGASFIGQAMYDSVNINRINVTGSSTNGLFIRAIKNSSVREVGVAGCTGSNISINECGAISVRAVTALNSSANGIAIANSMGVAMIHAEASNNVADGVNITGSVNVHIDSSKATNNGADGFDVSGSGNSNITINSCIATRNDARGYNCDNGSSHFTLNASLADSNGTQGVDIDADESVVAGNVITNNVGAGIYSGIGGVITSNHIGGNTGVGISLAGDNDCIVDGNHIHGNGAGIDVSGTSNDNCIITNNRIQDNTGDGLEIDSGSGNVMVGGNTLTGNTPNLTNNDTTTRFNLESVGGSSTDNAILRWDGTTGITVQNSGVTIDDDGNVELSTNGSSTGSPRRLSFVNFSSTEAYRWDCTGNDGIQSEFGGAVTMYAYNGIVMRGSRNATAPSFDSDTGIGLSVVNAQTGERALVVQAASGQDTKDTDGDLQQWLPYNATIGSGSPLVRIAADGTFQIERDHDVAPPTMIFVDTDADITTPDVIARIDFRGDDGGSELLGSYISAVATANWTSGTANDRPTELRFYCESDGSTSGLAAPALTINNLGLVVDGGESADKGIVTFGGEFAVTPSASVSIDWTNGQKQGFQLSTNTTISFGTNPPGPCNVVLRIQQNGSSTYTVSWPAAVQWPGGTDPTMTATTSVTDIYSFYFDGTTYYGVASQNFS